MMGSSPKSFAISSERSISRAFVRVERDRHLLGEHGLQRVKRRLDERARTTRAGLFVDRRRIALPLRIKEALAGECDRAEQRIRITRAAAATADVHVLRHRGLDHGQPATIVRHRADLRIVWRIRRVDQRALALEDALRRHRQHAGDARLRHLAERVARFNKVLRGLVVWPQDGRALRAVGLFKRGERGAATAASATTTAAARRRVLRCPRRLERRRTAMSMSPGYTVRPAPSVTMASAGIVTDAPTAWITPSRMTTEPLSMTAPETVTIFAPLIA